MYSFDDNEYEDDRVQYKDDLVQGEDCLVDDLARPVSSFLIVILPPPCGGWELCEFGNNVRNLDPPPLFRIWELCENFSKNIGSKWCF